jgi:aromatic-L-amino-acid decarboxylase
VGALSLTPAYLESRAGAGAPEYRDWSVPLARRFRSLKLWFVLRSYGAETLRSMVRSHIDYANRLAELIKEDSQFELCSGPTLAMLAFRFIGPGTWTTSQLDQFNERLLETINKEGFIYLTKTRMNDHIVIRFVIGQTYTHWKHVEEGWRAIQATAAKLSMA